jgi:hypothetical protein
LSGLAVLPSNYESLQIKGQTKENGEEKEQINLRGKKWREK